MSSLAKRLVSAQDKRIMAIFSAEIDTLHAQAESIGMSLKFFYEAALQEVDEIYIEAPDKEVALEQEEANPNKF